MGPYRGYHGNPKTDAEGKSRKVHIWRFCWDFTNFYLFFFGVRLTSFNNHKLGYRAPKRTSTTPPKDGTHTLEHWNIWKKRHRFTILETRWPFLGLVYLLIQCLWLVPLDFNGECIFQLFPIPILFKTPTPNEWIQYSMKEFEQRSARMACFS